MLPGFLLAVALIELTPGPNMGYLAIISGQWGRSAGFATVAGITLGLTLYMVAAAIGVAEAVLRLSWLYTGLRWAGIGYLVFLAIETWIGREETAPGQRVGSATRNRLFVRGLVANLLNPKAAVFYVALLPGFTNPALGRIELQALCLGVIHILVSVMVHSGIVVAAASAQRMLDRNQIWLRRGFAMGLLGVAAWLAWSTARP